MKRDTSTNKSRIRHRLKKVSFHLTKQRDLPLFTREIKIAAYGMIAFCFGIIMYNLTPNSNSEHMAPANLSDVKAIWKSFDFIGKRELLLENSDFSAYLSAILYPKREENQIGIEILPNYRSCNTPWGYPLLHWDSILAYQQDENTPNTCFIQRRFCWDGKLSWTFTLQSCKENKNYSYQKENFVVYNNPENINQVPSTPQKINNSNENISIIKETDPADIDPTFIIQPWTWKDEGKISSATPLDQTERPSMDCISPRWELVKDGQFIKAYKYRYWTNSVPCEVQLRTCVIGQLEWTYQFKECKVQEIES